MNWLLLRQRLIDLRIAAGLEVSDLAEEMSVDKTTLYRVENIDKDYAPRLETIEKWLAQTNGPALHVFLAALNNAGTESAEGQAEDRSAHDQAARQAARIQDLEGVLAVYETFGEQLQKLSESVRSVAVNRYKGSKPEGAQPVRGRRNRGTDRRRP